MDIQVSVTSAQHSAFPHI